MREIYLFANGIGARYIDTNPSTTILYIYIYILPSCGNTLFNISREFHISHTYSKKEHTSPECPFSLIQNIIMKRITLMIKAAIPKTMQTS